MKNKNILDENIDLLEDLDQDIKIYEPSEQEVITLLPPKARKKIHKKQEKILHFIYAIFAAFCFCAIVGILVTCVTYLPTFGTIGINHKVIVEEYIKNGITITEATNIVTGMILDYRAFDTLGESFVLFTGVTCVLILLDKFQDPDEPKIDKIRMFEDRILRYSAAILVPIIMLFGAYVILNGSISPGGGFSGGAIIGAGLILYSLAFSVEKTNRFFNAKTFKTITSVALLTYCCCKAVSFLASATGNPIHPFGTPGLIFSGGFIFILNCCVGLVVACTMFGFYLLFKKGEI